MSQGTVSVVLCTYNGAAFLREQLESIARQTHLPKEVLIRDDGSRDGTLEIVRQWAITVPFRVLVEANAANLGSTRNFVCGIAAATGDLIVLCDQDDIWLPAKLERITQYFADEPAAEALFTDGWVVDQVLTRKGLLSREVGFEAASIREDIRRGRFVRRLATQALATGATMALRATLREAVLPLPERLPGAVIHDGWIALGAALRGTLRFLDEPLILYRQHGGQQVGLTAKPGDMPAGKWRRGPQRRGTLARAAENADLLAKILHTRFPGEAAQLHPFDEHRAHLQIRSRLPATFFGRVVPVARELLTGRYHGYAKGWRTALADLLG